MTDYERIAKVLEYTKLSARALSIKLGLKTPQVFYDIKSGKCSISKDLALKLQDRFLIDINWTLNGKGPMLRPVVDSSVIVNGNGNFGNGNGNTIQQVGTTTSSAEAVLAERVKSLEALLNERERLIKAYEKMMDRK